MKQDALVAGSLLERANLFELLEGRRSEDLATQVLAFVLQHSHFRSAQQVFYELVLNDHALMGTAERGLQISTQSIDENGRPDLTISGEDIHILIENKFTAAYSGKDQLSRYAEILERDGARRRILILLCPRIWEADYTSQALRQFGLEAVDAVGLRRHLSERSIDFQVVAWDLLLQLWSSDSLLLAEFKQFITTRYLVSVSFSADEVQRLMSPEIPDLLDRIFRLIERLRGELNAMDVLTPRKMSFSQNYYVFYLQRGDWSFWLGYSLPQWKELKSPLVLKLESAGDLQRGALDTAMPSLGFKDSVDGWKEKSWWWPIELTAAGESTAFGIARDVQAKLDAVIAAFPKAEHDRQERKALLDQ